MSLFDLELDVLNTCVAALQASGADVPGRAFVGIKGEAPVGETLVVWWERTQQQGPVGVHSIRTHGVSVPTAEIHVRIYRAWPWLATQAGPGQVRATATDVITDAARQLADDTDVLVRALFDLAATSGWSDGTHRSALLGDCTPITQPARGLGGAEFALIVDLVD